MSMQRVVSNYALSLACYIVCVYTNSTIDAAMEACGGWTLLVLCVPVKWAGTGTALSEDGKRQPPPGSILPQVWLLD